MTVDVREELARVIPLLPHRDEMTAVETAHDRAFEILDRRVGDGWTELPAAAGRPALRVESLLAEGPTAIGSSVVAGVALNQSTRVLAAARVTLGLLAGQVELLGEALGTDLTDTDLAELQAIAAATNALSTASRPVPVWGSVAGAEAATVVLEVAAPVLRDAATAHEALYACFTERVWEIPVARVSAGTRRWRRLARRRLRRELRAVSRTSALPGGVERAARVVLDAHEARAWLAPLRPVLAHHLGVLDRGPLTDIDGALASLAAVRQLQRALGERHDDHRTERLLQADAFRSPEVARPANLVWHTISAWSADVEAAGGTDAPLAIVVDDLGRWVDEAHRDLPAVVEGWEAYRRVGAERATLRELVDALLLREHVANLAVSEDEPAEVQPAGDRPSPGRRWSAS